MRSIGICKDANLSDKSPVTCRLSKQHCVASLQVVATPQAAVADVEPQSGDGLFNRLRA